MRPISFLLIMVLLALITPLSRAANIVVLTEEPVAVFVLPDGSVLHNAYVWKRTAGGLMIIHDDGQFFLNYSTMPPEWKAAYLDETENTDFRKPDEDNKPDELEPNRDRYRIGNLLAMVPALAPETREKLLERSGGRELDQGVLVIGLMQAMLETRKEDANRCILYLEERGYEIDTADRDRLFRSCPVCGGDGQITRKCSACKGSGVCSECQMSASTLGKVSELDEKKSANCKVCDKTGECAECKGDGKIKVRCSTCKGSGKLVEREHCEAVRDKWVRTMNALVSSNAPASIMSSPSVDIGSTLVQLEGISSNAAAYYVSSEYDGAMDTNIVVACLMHSLVQKNLREAKRFMVMLDVEYPDNDVIEIKNYLKFCSSCEGKGWSQRSCTRCRGSGACEKCDGSGDDMGLNNWKLTCSDCQGSGECSDCDGSGKVSGRCAVCSGLGRVFERSRCIIRCELLVDELNEYYRQYRNELLSTQAEVVPDEPL